MKWKALLLSFLFLGIIIAPTIWIFPYLSQIKISGQLESFKLKKDEDLTSLLQIYNRFGSKHLLICGYSDPDLLTREGLKKLQNLSHAFTQSEYVQSVISLSTLKLPSKNTIYRESLDRLLKLHQEKPPELGNDGLMTFPDLGFFQNQSFLFNLLKKGVWVRIPETEAELKAYAEDVKNPLLVGRLISQDSRFAGILIDLKPTPHLRPSQLIHHFETIAQKQLPQHQVIFLGRQAIYAYLEESLRRDLTVCGMVAISLLALCFGVLFRSMRAILLPSLSIGVSVLWTAGFIYFQEYEVNILVVLAPVFILAIGATISIHLLTRYNTEIYYKTDKYVAIHKVLFGIQNAVFSSVLTSLIAFYALALSNLSEIVHFAHILSFGLISCTVLNFFFFYILNTFFPRMRTVREIPYLAKFLQKVLIPPLLRHRVLTLLVFVAISGFSIYGMHHVKPKHDIFSYLPPDSEIVQNLQEINKHLAGATLIFIEVKGSVPGVFQNPQNLARIRKLQAKLEKMKDIDAVLSYEGLLNSFSWLGDISSNEASTYHMATQHLLHLIVKNDPQMRQYFSRLMSSDYSDTLLILQTHQTSLTWLESIHKRLNKLCKEELGDRFVFSVTGDAIVVKNAVSKVLSSQIATIAVPLVAIPLFILVLFLSIKVMITCILPTLLPIIFFYGMLYYLDLGIDLSTGLIACVTIGISINNAIHFLFEFRKYLKITFDSQEAVLLAMGNVGSALLVTSLVLSMFYGVLLASQFPVAVRVGSLQVATMVMAMLCNLFLLPVLLSATRIVTLLDALTVKLKFDPATQSEFFKGLSKFQTKVVLAFGKLIHFSKGSYVLRSGETGESMFVLVNGSVEVTINPETQEKISLGPGATLGEVAAIAQVPRIADVIAQTEVDVLELNPSFFRIISKNYPKIATLLLTNLNRILVNRYILPKT